MLKITNNTMVFQLAILIGIPIILGIVTVSPFDIEPQEEITEEIPKEITEEKPELDILYILLVLIWIFFLIRILRQISKGTYRLRTKI